MTSTATARPDARPDVRPDVDQMDLAQVKAELAGYRPSTVAVPAYLARRVRLWARLDALMGVKRPAVGRTDAGSNAA
jgi:hypothetical protein